MKRKNIFFLFILALVIFCNLSCTKGERIKIYIGLSKGKGSEGYERYAQWLSSYDSNIICIDLYHLSLKSALDTLESCDGLVITGGPDVHPFYYNREWDSSRCDIDLRRDTLEFELIKRAMSLNMPILGICRGEQILNVSFGGSLYVDIPEDFGSKIIHRCPLSDTCFHDIRIIKNSLLYNICGVENGLVNTNHHQGIDTVSSLFIISAFSPDSFPEAIEWKDPKGKSFLLAVQWHPERLDKSNQLSSKIAQRFLEEVKKYSKKFKND